MKFHAKKSNIVIITSTAMKVCLLPNANTSSVTSNAAIRFTASTIHHHYSLVPTPLQIHKMGCIPAICTKYGLIRRHHLLWEIGSTQGGRHVGGVGKGFHGADLAVPAELMVVSGYSYLVADTSRLRHLVSARSMLIV